ncbi:MAG: MBL fold metallo-hydrolase [Propioniciclava sp.]
METRLGAFEAIADRVYRAIAEPDGVTLGLVVGDTSALVVDTGSTPEQGRQLRAAAGFVAGSIPLEHVVVTHGHRDHLLGLAAFNGLTTWGHRDLAAGLGAGLTDAELAARGISRDEVALPTRTFTLAATLDLGGAHAELVHFGRGHTGADVVVIIPERGVVFVGDLLESAGFPSVGPDSSLDAWPRTLDGTLGTLRAHSLVVPGHGPVMDQAGAFIQRAELAWLDGMLTQAWDAGTPLEDLWDATDQWPCTRAEAEAAAQVRFAQFERLRRPRQRRLPLLGS